MLYGSMPNRYNAMKNEAIAIQIEQKNIPNSWNEGNAEL
jgi:hypothetical protein